MQNEKKKFLKLNKIKSKNNHKFIKYFFIIILTILLLIEKFESQKTSIFFKNKQENNHNNTNLYNNKINDIKDKDNNQKEKNLNNAEFNEESNDTKNDNNSQKGNPGEFAFKTLYESFNSSKDFLDKGIKGILIQDKQKFILSENPIISAVIPLYNCKNVILRTLVQSKIKIYII